MKVGNARGTHRASEEGCWAARGHSSRNHGRLPWGLRGWSSRPQRLHPWAGKMPRRREWHPTPAFWPGDGQRSLAGCSTWGHKESDTTEQLTLSLHSTYNTVIPIAKSEIRAACHRLPSAVEERHCFFWDQVDPISSFLILKISIKKNSESFI